MIPRLKIGIRVRSAHRLVKEQRVERARRRRKMKRSRLVRKLWRRH